MPTGGPIASSTSTTPLARSASSSPPTCSLATPSDSLVSLGSGKGRATADRSLEQIARRYRTGRLLEKHPALFERLDFDGLRSRATLDAPDATADVPLYKRFDLDHYADSYVSVVTESEMSDGQVQRITEKIVKPFLFGHLAVVAGNPGALAIVRELGFQTFEPLIDESYDAIADPNERLCAVLCEVDRLRSLTDDAMHRLFMELEEVRRANLGYGRDVLPHRVRIDARTTVAAPSPRSGARHHLGQHGLRAAVGSGLRSSDPSRHGRRFETQLIHQARRVVPASACLT